MLGCAGWEEGEGEAVGCLGVVVMLMMFGGLVLFERL